MCVRACVAVAASVSVCFCAYMRARVSVGVSVCLEVGAFVCVRIECYFVLVSVDLSLGSLHVRLCKCVLVCAYVYRSVREHRCLCVFVCL